MKVVALEVLGADQEPLILELSPGITAKDLLAEANLADYALARASEPAEYLSAEEDLFALLTDCETLIATFSTKEADAYIRSFFNEE